MLCRALLTIIAISYLICVLILSGLQKEDLDVNMLKKLEHHGLDIDDINNERLRKDCLELSVAKTTDKDEHITEEPPITSTTTEKALKSEMTQRQEKNTNKTELEAVMKYFINLQKTERKINPESDYVTTTKKNILDNYHIPQSSNLKYIFSDLIGYNSPQLNKDNLQTLTTDRTLQFYSQNVIRLWNTYIKKDIRDSSTPTSTTLQTSTVKTIKSQNKNYPEGEIIKKIIEEYFSKNLISSTTTQLPPIKKLDMAKISDEIRRFLADFQNKNQNKFRETDKTTENINVESDKIDYENKTVHKPHNNENKEEDTFFKISPTLKEKIDETETRKNRSSVPIEDMVQLNEQKIMKDPFANYKDMQNNKEIPNENQNLNLESSKIIKKDSLFNKVNNLYANMKNGNRPKAKEKSLPTDIIKEIAESVKAIVLKDLKKEMSTLTPHFVSSTTETTSTTTIKSSENKAIEATHMMEKFMELFQQYKTTNEKTIITGNSQMKVTERKDVKHEYKGPVTIIYSSNKSAINPYAVHSSGGQFSPIFLNKQHEEFNVNTPKHIVLPNIQNPVYQIHQSRNYNVKTGLSLTPITIQTNSFEVAPLGIPIEKPISMVNQNIIVTTKRPIIRPKVVTHHTSYIHHIDRYKIEDDFIDRKPRQKSLVIPKREYHPRVRDDTYTLDENENFKAKMNDRFDIHDYGHDYKPHFSKPDYDRMRIRNKEIKRFHERLENESKNTEEKDDCCKVRVASRQQLPLVKAKKSRYDDVHFRNFLKTQQKVNDMLERILATKTKSDGPHSVEIS